MAQNMKAVKTRIKSVQSTMQITKAMELVASSKLRRAKERADTCRPYFNALFETLQTIASGNTDFSSVYTKSPSGSKSCYVVIAGDRGLAGGYNNNLFKTLQEETGNADYSVLPIGKKALEYAQRKHLEIISEEFGEVGEISVADCFSIAKLLCDCFRRGEFSHVGLVYTEFVTMLSQQPRAIPLLPISDLDSRNDDCAGIRNLILYEPDSTVVFDRIVPEFLGGVVYCSVCESVASEQAARRTAMESATGNAEEMIEKLNLYYNRARQASITQEITEIVGGSEGL